MKLTETQSAYLAGLIDGEGSLECQKEMQVRGATPRFSLRLSFCFGTSEPITTVAAWIGLAPTIYPPVDAIRCARWRLHVPKSLAVEILLLTMPFLIAKKEQARLVLQIENVRRQNTPSRHHKGQGYADRMPASAIAEMDGLFWKLRALKSNKRRMDARVNKAA